MTTRDSKESIQTPLDAESRSRCTGCLLIIDAYATSIIHMFDAQPVQMYVHEVSLLKKTMFSLILDKYGII